MGCQTVPHLGSSVQGDTWRFDLLPMSWPWSTTEVPTSQHLLLIYLTTGIHQVGEMDRCLLTCPLLSVRGSVATWACGCYMTAEVRSSLSSAWSSLGEQESGWPSESLQRHPPAHSQHSASEILELERSIWKFFSNFTLPFDYVPYSSQIENFPFWIL